MNVGIDLDGTITECPLLFTALTKGLRAMGHHIHIITFRSERKEEVAKTLDKLDVTYDEIHLPGDNDVNLVAWKRRIAASFKITVMIDDMPEVLSEMPENVTRLWVCQPEHYDLKKIIKTLNHI